MKMIKMSVQNGHLAIDAFERTESEVALLLQSANGVGTLVETEGQRVKSRDLKQVRRAARIETLRIRFCWGGQQATATEEYAKAQYAKGWYCQELLAGSVT
jgi:hypothetical protein